MLIVKAKPLKSCFPFNPCSHFNKVLSCNLETKYSFELGVVTGNNIRFYCNGIYTHAVYYPMFIELSCAVL